ncbi:MAG: DUF1330 domain-containing protein [Alphaproteobacteria bacterium]|nr:DUF1330 domain-containing protein [Alphaproteobacteria bacterium]
MSDVEPTDKQFEVFSKGDMKQPLAMLNLLRFKDVATYEPGSKEPKRSGAEAYGLYGMVAQQKVREVGGHFIYVGPVQQIFVGPSDVKWDMMALVYYPSREAFLRMVAMPDYQAATFHRRAGLDATRLIQCDGTSVTPAKK